MSTKREQQLTFCKICVNQKFNAQKGLLCGLTNEYASFEETCPSFEVDEQQKKRSLQFDLKNAGHDGASRSLDFRKNKDNGTIITAVGAVLLGICILYLNGIIPLLLSGSVLLYGIRTYNRGQAQESVLEKRKEFDEKHEQG
ncbi:hypothetical protein [Owenweeksia hongkongensis]|uniref:hypothetical protein n=1 Tax=Owenweeksia hongkongensis TaxID=253245 RepID=UPI003A8F5A2C